MYVKSGVGVGGRDVKTGRGGRDVIMGYYMTLAASSPRRKKPVMSEICFLWNRRRRDVWGGGPSHSFRTQLKAAQNLEFIPNPPNLDPPFFFKRIFFFSIMSPLHRINVK